MTQQKTSNYEVLIDKLDQFTRKYYVNQLIRGSLYWLALAGAMFLVYNLLEHNYYFGMGVRKFMFFSFIAVSAAGLGFWVARPLFRIFNLGRRISHEQAAQIIGQHFTDVQDKLLNVLQLKRQADQSSSPQLAFASIQQKTDSIKLVPFKNAINLNQNRKYLRYALPPLLVLLALMLGAPSVIKDSTARIIHNNQEFEKDAPFHFVLEQQDDLSVVQYEDYLLHVSVEGATLPNEVFINVDDYQYRLKKEQNNRFTYRFKNVHADTRFNLFAGPVASKSYTLEVLKKPNLLSFDVRLDYPAYTGRKDEVLANIGDLVVPTGTTITWEFNTLNTDEVEIAFNDEDAATVDRKGSDLFSQSKRVLEDMRYVLNLSNANLQDPETIEYSVNVIPDLYPKISVEQFRDSLQKTLVYFVGSVGDDYGISNLTFNYQITNENEQQEDPVSFPLSLKNRTQFQYDYTFDINDLALRPGQQLSYYFEVFDNDAINGSKSTRTGLMTFKKPSLEEYEQMEEQNSEDIKETLKNAMKESSKLQEEMRKLREKLLQEKDLEWQNKKEMENLMKRQQDLQNDLQNAQDLFQENLQNQEEYENPSQEMQEKQEKLNEFFEELMNEEMQEMMEKMQEMMEELQKKDALEMLENFELSEEELQKELDRLMELFKQMELEQEIQEQVEKLQQLAEEQEALSEKTENADEEKNQDEGSEQEQNEEQEGEQQEGEQSEEQQSEQQESEQEQEQSGNELQQEQQQIQEEFQDIREEMEKIEEKNQELERPKNLDGTDEQMDRIEQDMNNSQQQMQQQQNQKASESQKSAAQRMREMAQQLQQQMMQGQMQQMQADMGTLRQLLENLITLSFDQEDIIDQMTITNVNTPRYVALVQDQFKIKDDFKVVEDTLQALSKRVMQIESFISEKVTEIKSNLRSSLDDLEERKKATAADFQQRTMTNLNDLALMLSEVMNQMQQQMAMMMPGQQMCDSPANMPGQQNGRVPLDKITEGQQQLNEDMKQIQEGMGRQEGEKGSSEQFARMAARQAALRKALRDLQQEKQQQGQGDESLENTIEQMDKIETELVNKQLTNEMLKRQQEILTRLLEAERAERQREMDNKRKSETARQIERKLPPAIEEYIKQREAEVESFQTVSPALRPYYKFLVEEYYDALKKQ